MERKGSPGQGRAGARFPRRETGARFLLSLLFFQGREAGACRDAPLRKRGAVKGTVADGRSGEVPGKRRGPVRDRPACREQAMEAHFAPEGAPPSQMACAGIYANKKSANRQALSRRPLILPPRLPDARRRHLQIPDQKTAVL